MGASLAELEIESTRRRGDGDGLHLLRLDESHVCCGGLSNVPVDVEAGERDLVLARRGTRTRAGHCDAVRSNVRERLQRSLNIRRVGGGSERTCRLGAKRERERSARCGDCDCLHLIHTDVQRVSNADNKRDRSGGRADIERVNCGARPR